MLRDILTGRVLGTASRAAKEQATPFYLFDAMELLRQARAWRRAAEAAQGVEIFYPYKCNRAAEVLEPLAAEGFGAEVTSVADFRAAAALGSNGERIVIQGPAKERDLIDAGLAAGSLFVADGREDALAILARARALATRPRYLLRLAPSAVSDEQRPFGLRPRELLAMAREVCHSRAPLPEGLAFHLGTGIASTAPYLDALREAAAVSAKLAAMGISISLLDLGGGFAARSEARLDARGRPGSTGKEPAAILPPLIRQARRLLGPRLRLLSEPGRALVSGSFHLVARVVRVRERRPRTTVYLNASCVSHAFFVAQGKHPIAAIPRRRGPLRAVALAGPLGVGLDLFTPAARLPLPAPGDLVVIGSVGAYNWNAASAWAAPLPPTVTLPPPPLLSSRRRQEAR